ncbi:class III lanthionine synthetase LanKC [Luteibacter yeojuensis]|uniref:Protein kinase/lanthionine synthetase C family protein n=1 Tax=Luteibacter yeojuensis TaxID=345309 RepID=A0A7X5QW04_9GAMM|nr:class III lanthionine synthetase LanKC [Luteibacter yeojuensis]NID16450.1 protein kinase/lanthionine synthetase C family protein [Luteibacter yeojuensis]
MERHTELLQYTAVDKEFFEPYGRREIDTADFVQPVRRIVPEKWQLRRSGIWMHCSPPGVELPAQGWKIHVSSVASTARIVLSIAAAALVASGTAFKFAADARTLAAINGKRWPRGGSGKFITVYPRGVDDFRRIIDDLHVALSGYVGPYILSDRRYRDSRVLYYRYGGIAGEYRIAADGRREYLLRAPDGQWEVDERKPCFHLPPWLRDPFPGESDETGGAAAHLGAGRFRIRKALSFSSAGGIYVGEDLDEGRQVIIKEARPFIGGGDTATAALRKEFRLLRRLAPLRVAPMPIAHFREWEHSYLVEEFIDGDTLRCWLARRYPWLKTRATRDDAQRYLREVAEVFTRFAEALELVHDIGVSMGDLSFHNCIVTPGGEVRLIDLETAIEEGLDLPVDLRTPGFASPRPLRDHPDAARAEDAYAFGANLLAAIMPMNAMLPLDRQAASRFVHRMSEDVGYPGALADIVGELLHGDATKRPTPVAAMATLRRALEAAPSPAPATGEEPVTDRADALFAYISGMAIKARADRYVPAGPEVFQSHPWGVAHGASGVLHAYLRGGRTPPQGLLDYVVDGARRRQDRGTSLMHGDAGIAWVLFDAGERELAASLLRDHSPDEAIRERAGLHDGMAGWGFARIKAWRETAESCFLTAAAEAGEILLRDAVATEGMLRWPRAGSQPVGLAHGGAGIALFLLHLHVATGDERFLRSADAALAYDLAQRGANPDGDAAWPKKTGGATLFPYLRHGTAGIVAVAARFHACTADARYRHIVRGAEADLMRRHAICPGLFDGLAGIGETLLDLAETFPDSAAGYLAAAKRIAGGIEPFLVSRDEGFAVPGAELLRISCDFATGNAGVGAFFDRLHRGGPASFMLDDHLSLASLKFCDGVP